MLQESDEIFVEKCGEDASPRSFYTKDPVLFEAHLLHQLKRACEVIDGDFTFLVSFQGDSLIPSARKTLEERLKLKEQDSYMKKTAKLFERDVTQ